MAFEFSGDVVDLLIRGIGAGTEGTISSWINKYIGLGDYAGLLGGALLWYFGDRIHEKVKVFGEGVLIGSIAKLVSQYVGSALQPSQQTQTTVRTAGYNPNLEAYIYSGGGI